MKRTDFSVDWLFAACAPDTELLPWNAQFTPVDLPHDWQIRHADDLYRDGTLFYRKYFFVTDVPGTRRMLWFGGAYMDTTVFVNGTEVGQWKMVTCRHCWKRFAPSSSAASYSSVLMPDMAAK